jgi:NAD(P)-dependent dehydrogenase (short-subunit alcohol dehydrogenase family)
MNSPIALVTGSSRGIGRGIAIELAHAGYRVAVNFAGNEAAADETLRLITDAGSSGFTIRGDISVATDRTRLIEETVQRLGGIDLLVNNAGIAPKTRGDLLDSSEASLDELFAVNLKGPFLLTQLAAKQMLKQTPGAGGLRGRIVNITSISVYTASVNRGDYCMVKAGLSMMTKLFADRLANISRTRFGVSQRRPSSHEPL